MKAKMILSGVLAAFLILAAYFFIGFPSLSEGIVFGVNFSQKHAKGLGLDWKETYLALLDDLKVKDIKLITHWDLIEPERGNFCFGDLDWQIEEAEKRNAKILLVIGMKTGRWPECHIPEWAKGLDKTVQQEEIIGLIEQIVLRYRERPSLSVWGVENEPLFPFGECPWIDKEFLKREIDLVKSFDPEHPILISDSGEGSLWIEVARLGDIVGTTIYKRVWIHNINRYFSYPFPSVFYRRKAELIKAFFGKEVICAELQAEPWCPNLLYNCSLEEQEKTMDLEQLKYNIKFAKNTGFDRFYLWGSEWWYWMKENQNRSEMWEEVRELF